MSEKNDDYRIETRDRGRPTLYRWEIFKAGNALHVKRSDYAYPTRLAAIRGGESALARLRIAPNTKREKKAVTSQNS